MELSLTSIVDDVFEVAVHVFLVRDRFQYIEEVVLRHGHVLGVSGNVYHLRIVALVVVIIKHKYLMVTDSSLQWIFCNAS